MTNIIPYHLDESILTLVRTRKSKPNDGVELIYFTSDTSAVGLCYTEKYCIDFCVTDNKVWWRPLVSSNSGTMEIRDTEMVASSWFCRSQIGAINCLGEVRVGSKSELVIMSVLTAHEFCA